MDDTQFASDIAHLQSLGKKVLISVGGANGSASIETPEARNNFTNSIIEIIRQYGFDGIDINLEGKVRLASDDVDFRNPISASIRHLITAIREIQGSFGPDFILSLAPESMNVQGGFRMYSGLSGSYLPVIHGLRDILTYLQVQHYNASQLDAGDHTNYTPGTADFHVAMAGMLLRGFFVQDDPSQFFPPLQPEQIVIGLAASPNAVNNGYSSLAETEKALQYLMKGDPFGGQYVLPQASDPSSLRGIMAWSINWDAVDRCLFSGTMHSFLHTLLEIQFKPHTH
jgi:chitinase